MPPRLNPWGACRSFALRSRPQVQSQQPSIATAFARHLASQPPNSNTPTGNGRSIPPIPPSMLPPGESPSDEQDASSMTEQGEQSQLSSPEDAATPWRKQHKIAGLKFEAPPMPMAKLREAQYHMKYRYDEGIAQITRLLMRHGKLSKAQNDMAMVLNYLRTTPPPKVNPERPLVGGSPPPEHLPLNPNLYMMAAIDSVAPLIRIRGYIGLAGGGKPLEIPLPLAKRARRRTAFMWIMEVVNKKQSSGSGKKMLAHRIGEEIVAVAQGTSAVWDKRLQLHKKGVTLRSNLLSPRLKNIKIM